MNKPKLYMLVGLSGSGKSSYNFEEEVVKISSDALRAELYGDENDQTHNTEVFNELHKRVISNLKNGNKIVIETNYAKFEYTVKTSKIVNETDLNSLEKDYDLILYTCYPNKELYGNKRLIIYAKLDKTKWVGES